jgi:hypothetical protein
MKQHPDRGVLRIEREAELFVIANALANSDAFGPVDYGKLYSNESYSNKAKRLRHAICYAGRMLVNASLDELSVFLDRRQQHCRQSIFLIHRCPPLALKVIEICQRPILDFRYRKFVRQQSALEQEFVRLRRILVNRPLDNVTAAY